MADEKKPLIKRKFKFEPICQITAPLMEPTIFKEVCHD